MASGIGKKASKVTKKARKQLKKLPGRNKNSSLSKVTDSLPTGGGLVAGLVGTYVMRKMANGAKDRVKSIAQSAEDGPSALKETAKGLVSSGDGGQDKAARVKLREIIQEYIDVSVPRDFAYNEWKDFESLNDVFKGIQWVRDEDGELRWKAKIGPSTREWGAEVKDDVEERKIGWESTGGEENLGIVAFHALDQNLTRVMLQMEYHPKGVVASFGNLMRMQRRRVRRDLRLFKHHVELKAEEGDRPKTRDEDDEKSSQQGSQRQDGNGRARASEASSQNQESGAGEEKQDNGRADLEDQSVDELRKAASILRVRGYSKMNKEELVEALEGHKASDAR
jgi:uncharacterized membrane protein